MVGTKLLLDTRRMFDVAEWSNAGVVVERLGDALVYEEMEAADG